MRGAHFAIVAALWGPFSAPAQQPSSVVLPPASPPSTSGPQQPNIQPGWPCTGKERAFDPVYGKIAEATGGHLFLFDRSEAAGWAALELGDRKHHATIVRATGMMNGSLDIPFWVDASVQSVFVVASLQCMQTVYVYDPQRSGIDAKVQGVEDIWFRAGRISTIPRPQAGQWVLRLLGSGWYSVAFEAQTNVQVNARRERNALSISVSDAITNPIFRLIDAAGAPIEPVALTRDPDSPAYFRGTIEPLPAVPFRIQVESRDAQGQTIWRTDARLFEPAAPAAPPAK